MCIYIYISEAAVTQVAECQAGREIPLRRTCDLDRRMEELEVAELPLLRRFRPAVLYVLLAVFWEKTIHKITGYFGLVRI